jgi:hypothetical protein
VEGRAKKARLETNMITVATFAVLALVLAFLIDAGGRPILQLKRATYRPAPLICRFVGFIRASPSDIEGVQNGLRPSSATRAAYDNRQVTGKVLHANDYRCPERGEAA